ncbi:MAG: cytochrome c3 family protein [Acidobacteria bacterium]|nr:cytochrome c3 family protein [Acidobacteriota bacterium]
MDCIKCHGPIAAAAARKVKHPAMEGGCDSCHVNHRDQKARAEAKGDHYLTDKQPAVCGGCHDVAEKKLLDTHKGQPFATAECSGCHNPHGSDQPKLIAEMAHSPFDARACDSCHKPPKDGKVVLNESSTSKLCFGCHADVEERLKKAKFQHTLLKSDDNSCADCHDPHASGRKFGLRKPVAELCSACHSDLTDGKKFVHKPVTESCTACHNAHASDFEKNTHAAVNDLCLGCHGPSALKIVQGPEPVSLFGGKVALPAKAYEDLSWLQLSNDGKLGHPYPQHPVSAPASEGKAEITCLSCHKPHAANGSAKMLVTETARADKLCIRCHGK